AQHDGVGQGHHHHAAVGEANQRRQGGGQQEQECRLAVGGGDARQVGAGVDGHRQGLEVGPADLARLQRRLHFIDVHGGNEHVVADGGQQAIGGEEHHRLDVHIEGQHPVDDGGKQVLVVDHRNDGEEHHQQGGEGQRLLEGAADLVLLDDAVEGG